MSGSAASLSRTSGTAWPLRLVGDERLVQLAAAGSERAFAAIYDRHARALYRYCRSILHHDHDAQDALQAAMTRALAALSRGAPDAPLRPWLFRIAHNEAVSLLRRRLPAEDLDGARSIAGTPLERRLEDRRRLQLLVADLQDLPDRQRAALVMRELSGLSHEEIAAALEVSLSAAKQAIFEARVGLQEFARGREMRCADVQRLISDRDGRVLRARSVRAHVRSCEACREMRDAIGVRRDALAALAPPLPTAAAAGVLARIFGGGGHGGGTGGLASATAGKSGAAALAAKVVAGTAIVATTVSVGPPHVLRPVVRHQPDRPALPRSAGAPSAVGAHVDRTPTAAAVHTVAAAPSRVTGASRTQRARARGVADRRVPAVPAPAVDRARVESPSASAAPAQPLAPGPAPPHSRHHGRPDAPPGQGAGPAPAAGQPAATGRRPVPAPAADTPVATGQAGSRRPAAPPASANADPPSRPARGGPAPADPTAGTPFSPPGEQHAAPAAQQAPRSHPTFP